MKVEFLENGSPDCPLVRLYGTDQADFASLHLEIRRLATGEVARVAVHRLPGFEGIGGCGLTMVSSPREAGVRRPNPTLSFEWRLTPPTWDIASDFTRPFASDRELGRYQWLAGRRSYFGIDEGEIALLISATEDGAW